MSLSKSQYGVPKQRLPLWLWLGQRPGLELASVKHWHAKFLENVTLVLFDSSDLPNKNVCGTKDYIPLCFSTHKQFKLFAELCVHQNT